MENNANNSIVKKPSVLAASLLYLVVLLLMVGLSLASSRFEFAGNSSFLILFIIQIVAILVPPMVYLVVKRINIKKTTRINRISLGEFFLVIGMAVFGYGVIIPINFVWNILLSKIGTPQTGTLPDISSPEQYLLALAVIALTPAIAEEFLFRGVIMRGYEKLGTRVSIVLTAIMFSLLHLSIVSLPFTLLLGILLAYIVYRSNTLFTGILYHFINNSIAVTLVYVSSILQKLFPIGEEAVESIRDIPDAQLKFTLIVMAVFGFIALAFFSGCFAGFILVTKGKHKATKEAKIKDKEQIYAGSERQDELSLNTMDIQNASEPAKRRTRIVDFIPTLIAVAIIIGILVMELLTMISSAS